MTEWIGLLAAALTTLSLVPQAMMVLRTGKTDGISVLMYSMFLSGVVIWVIYGILIASAPLVIANSLTFVFAACVLVVAVRNHRRGNAGVGSV